MHTCIHHSFHKEVNIHGTSTGKCSGFVQVIFLFFKDLMPEGAQYRTCERGISILVCRPRGIAETERLRDVEHATEATRGTRTFKEASNLTTSKPRLPASNFHEVRRNIGTFCAFIHTLFGSKCEYYSKLMDLKQIFNNSSMQTIHNAFNVNVCHCIIWAIVCNGRFFSAKSNSAKTSFQGLVGRIARLLS